MAKKSKHIQRRDLAKAAAQHLPLTIEQCVTVVDTIFSEIANALMSGKDVVLYGFGDFTQEIIPERQAFHPRDRTPITAKAYRKMRFRPTPALKKRVRESITKTQDIPQ